MVLVMGVHVIWMGLPGAQNELLLHILKHGPSPAYGTHKILKKPQSTIQTAMRDLKDAGLVSLYGKEEGEKGGTKLMYGLTLYGFCYGFSSIVKRETTTYELIERLINRWQHLCPEVLGNWDLLIEEEQAECSFPGDYDGQNYFWQDEQLPYQVPNMKVKHWILFIDEICSQTAQEHQNCEYESECLEDLPSLEKRFIDLISVQVCQYALDGVDGRADLGCPWNTSYLLCVFRRIPGIWNHIRHDLIRWKDMHERGMLRIQRVLDMYDSSP